ncbi:MAG TPA: molybdate ABC transporter substrate-binding protein [Candidatus Binatia bacterium]|nr:molybdate ABC transporter substrate-binding protein [Candidatus Binatia bacterium]
MNRSAAIILTTSFAMGLSLPTSGADSGRITVYAAGSLREAFDAAGPAFTKKTGIAVMFNFAGSDMLAAQIKQGAPADVFASANTIQMKMITEAGLGDGPPKLFARNRIVLITPRANPGHINGFASLMKPGAKVVLAEPAEPVGIYAREAFKKLSGNGYPSDFAAAVERNVVSNELNEKAVAAKISLGEGDAGVVYSTDITSDIASQVNVIPFPAGVTSEIMYPIVALRGAQNVQGAHEFVRFIVTEGTAFLKARGFLPP